MAISLITCRNCWRASSSDFELSYGFGSQMVMLKMSRSFKELIADLDKSTRCNVQSIYYTVLSLVIFILLPLSYLCVPYLCKCNASQVCDNSSYIWASSQFQLIEPDTWSKHFTGYICHSENINLFRVLLLIVLLEINQKNKSRIWYGTQVNV